MWELAILCRITRARPHFEGDVKNKDLTEKEQVMQVSGNKEYFRKKRKSKCKGLRRIVQIYSRNKEFHMARAERCDRNQRGTGPVSHAEDFKMINYRKF